MIKIFKLEELDLSKITFAEPNGNIIDASYDNKYPVLFETLEMYCPDGIRKNKTKYSTHELLVTLNNRSNFFELLDDKLIEVGRNNINKWPFNSKTVTYKSLIRFIDEDDNEGNSGVIKVKFIKSKNFNTLVFDKNKNIINPDNYDKILCGNVHVKMILELVSVWIRDDVYGAYLKLHQLKVSNGFKPSIMQQEYSFNDSSIDEEMVMCDTEINTRNNTSEMLNDLDSIMIKGKKEQVFEYVISDSSE